MPDRAIATHIKPGRPCFTCSPSSTPGSALPPSAWPTREGRWAPPGAAAELVEHAELAALIRDFDPEPPGGAQV